MAEFHKACKDCGVHFVAGSYNAQYCPKCRQNRRKETQKKCRKRLHREEKERSAQKQPEPKPQQKKQQYSFQPRKCPEDCVYLRTIEGERKMCGYLFATGEMRGCDPGLGCNKYVGKREDLKNARHRKVTWDVVNGKKLWQAGWKDSMIAKVMRVKTDTVKAYRIRVWEKEKQE